VARPTRIEQRVQEPTALPFGDDVGRRAALPEVMLLPDLALALGVTPSAARRIVLRGEIGPYSRVGRRIVVRRAAFLAALEAREVRPEPPLPPPVPEAPEWAKELLRRGRRGL
jgi:hypothetical protein